MYELGDNLTTHIKIGLLLIPFILLTMWILTQDLRQIQTDC